MKKKLLFLIPMIIATVLLFMLRATGMKVHIAVSVIALALLIAYTVATKKEWKIPALEIICRVCYGIAIVTGVVLMNVHGVVAVTIIHRITAFLFIGSLVGAEVHKAIKK